MSLPNVNIDVVNGAVLECGDDLFDDHLVRDTVLLFDYVGDGPQELVPYKLGIGT